MSAPSEVAQAGSFTFTAFLFDDTNSPLADEEIAWEETLQTTRRDGKVEFSKYAQLWLWFRDMNLTCSFEGSDKYLPSHSSKMVVSCPNFFLLIFPPAVVASAVSGYLVYRRRRRRSGLSAPEGSGAKEPASKKHVYLASEKSPLVLSFPDIQPPFPNVWGAGENLRIRCSLGKAFGDGIEGGKVSFLIDDDLVGEGRLSTRKDAVMSESFAEKGTYMISARALDESGSSLRTDVDLRIVDYREEIIALYKIFLQRLHSLNVEVEDDITARELQSRLASHEMLDKNQVENLVSCFEEADYSNHPVGRRLYERMYLSFEGLKGAQ